MTTALERLQSGFYNNGVVSPANPGGLAGTGALRANFFGGLIPDLLEVVGLSKDAAVLAESALNAPGTICTSVTNTNMPASGGQIALVVQTNKSITPNQNVTVYRTSNRAGVRGYGKIASYNPANGQLTIDVEESTGAAGPFADWTVSLTAYGVPASRRVDTSGLATGGADLSTNLTINVPAASAADLRAGTAADKAVTPKAIDDADAGAALTDAATVAWNIATQGAYAKLLLTAAVGSTRQIGAPTNPKDGKPYIIDFQQPAAGGPCSATFSSYFDFTGVAVQWSTAASKVDRLTFFHNATTGKGEVMSWRKGS